MAKANKSAGSKFLNQQSYGIVGGTFAGTNALTERPLCVINTEQQGLPPLGPSIKIYASDSSSELEAKRTALQSLRETIETYVTKRNLSKGIAPNTINSDMLLRKLLKANSLQLDNNGENNTNIANVFAGLSSAIYSNADVVGVVIAATADYVPKSETVKTESILLYLLLAEPVQKGEQTVIVLREAQYEIKGLTPENLPNLRFETVTRDASLEDHFIEQIRVPNSTKKDDFTSYIPFHMENGKNPAKDLREAADATKAAYDKYVKAETISQFLECFAELVNSASTHDMWIAYQRAYEKTVLKRPEEMVFFGKNRHDRNAKVVLAYTVEDARMLRALHGIYGAAGKAIFEVNNLIGEANTQEAAKAAITTRGVVFTFKETPVEATVEVPESETVNTNVTVSVAETELDMPVSKTPAKPAGKKNKSHDRARIPVKQKQEAPEIIGVGKSELDARLAELAALHPSKNGGKKK